MARPTPPPWKAGSTATSSTIPAFAPRLARLSRMMSAYVPAKAPFRVEVMVSNLARVPARLTRMDRRRFLFATASGLAAAPQPRLTARGVIERIQKNVGVPWRTPTVDTFKAGDPDTPVTGIATTFTATEDVLQRAADSGKNLIITHAPTSNHHEDETKDVGA